MIIDLTHYIEENMPVYPGTEPPVIKQANTIAEHGFDEKLLTLFSHTGTHMDAPCHVCEGQKNLSGFTLNELYGRGCLIDASGESVITSDFLKNYADGLEKSEIAVIYTGWDRLWGSEGYFCGFPVMDTEAAEYLVSTGIRGVAVDVISVDRVDCESLDVHKVLFKNNIFVTENLKGLERLFGKEFFIGIFPLNIKDGDGAPVRAAAFIQT